MSDFRPDDPPPPLLGGFHYFHSYVFYASPKWKVNILYQLNITVKVSVQDYKVTETKYSQITII